MYSIIYVQRFDAWKTLAWEGIENKNFISLRHIKLLDIQILRLFEIGCIKST